MTKIHQKRDFSCQKKLQRVETFFLVFLIVSKLVGFEKGHRGKSNGVSTIFFGLLAASVDAFEVEKFLGFCHIFLRKIHHCATL